MRRFLLACALLGCAANGSEASENNKSGTGSIDAVSVEARTSFERAQGITSWDIELHLLDDDADATTDVISTTDAMRVGVEFWTHGEKEVHGRFNIDVTRWLSLSVERNPDDIAAIFEGTSVDGVSDPKPYLEALMVALAEHPEDVTTTSSALSEEGLGSCVSGLKKALAAISATFKTCVACASDFSWDSCGKCEKGITDAKSAIGLFDLLACKKALVLPPTGGDSDDAGGPLVTLPETVKTATCYELSSDKVHGTMRVTDGKGSVSCADCPSDMVPADNKLGCSPTVSPLEETKSIVYVPAGKGKAATPRVVSSDVCVVVDVTGNGTVNGDPIEKGPSRAIIKLGDRAWAALPKNVQTSKDQWDLTSNKHSSSTKGKYALTSTSSSKKTIKTVGTVEEAIAKGGCSSHPVIGLSEQILDELARCVRPGFLVKVQSGGQLVTSADLAYLEKPAADALGRALKSRPGKTITINSMFRTVAQQYFLYRHASCFAAVASPGRSNHETGIALDVGDYGSWVSALQGAGFTWLGSKDRVHFDYRGAGSVDLRGDDVKAFQRLWNRNHPDDRIAEDGVWGGDTESRLKKSPAGGFPIGALDSCEAAPKLETSKGSREPYEYLANVTADLLPGEGCETGSDASHTDVNGCVSVKQVCEPFWCDLADQRKDECR
jgi:hypothetical protein